MDRASIVIWKIPFGLHSSFANHYKVLCKPYFDFLKTFYYFFLGEVRKFDEITLYTFCVRSGKEKKDELIDGGGQL